MTRFTGRRWPVITLAAALICLVVPAVAAAEPPTNDDFDTATAITALPFEVTQDTSAATVAPDDPPVCGFQGTNSVWFRYTAAADALVRVSTVTSGFSKLLAAYTGARGSLTQVPGVCTFAEAAMTVPVTAGTTYHIVVMSDSFSAGGSLTLRLETVERAPNDDFAAAQPVPGLPATVSGDLDRATGEPDEPLPSCDDTATRSVWYVYRPTVSRSVGAQIFGVFTTPTVTVYRGSALTDLSQVDCTVGWRPVFTATAGETYYIRVADQTGDVGRFTMTLETAPPPRIDVFTVPSQPSTLDDIQFFLFSSDQFNRPLVAGELRFGDGTSAPIGTQPIRHRYAVDGTYRVDVTATTDDGRIGTGSMTLLVQTHDISIASFTVPANARVDQTRPITVGIANDKTRYDENVSVQLLKQTGDGFFESVAITTQWVPARPNHTVDFPFAYTFSEADAAAGSVTFRAVASLNFPTRDIRPDDNEQLATTTVR